MAKGRPWPEKVDGAGFAVIGAENSGAGLVAGGQRAINTGDLIDHLLPAEAVGIKLREGAGCLVLHVLSGVAQVHARGVVQPLLRTQDRHRHRESDHAADEQNDCVGGNEPAGAAPLEKGLPADAASSEDCWVDRGEVVVFRIAGGEHEREKDQIGPAEKAPLPTATADQKPDHSRNP